VFLICICIFRFQFQFLLNLINQCRETVFLQLRAQSDNLVAVDTDGAFRRAEHCPRLIEKRRGFDFVHVAQFHAARHQQVGQGALGGGALSQSEFGFR
jgi:hypothetical protein